jgi:nucleotide-binding universal stress UspA family protein
MPNGVYPAAHFDSHPRGSICERPGLGLHSSLRDDAESLVATVGSARIARDLSVVRTEPADCRPPKASRAQARRDWAMAGHSRIVDESSRPAAAALDGRVHERPVLCAYDGFEDAKAAIRQAGRQFRSGRAAIVLTVWKPFRAMPFASAPVAPVGLDANVEREARRVADEGARLARLSGFEAEPIAERGDSVSERIVQSAEEHDASIVALGAHGRTHTRLVAMGSVAAATAEQTVRPVLIVHASPRRRAA